MGADTDDNGQFRFDGAQLGIDIGRLVRCLGLRVGQLALEARQGVQHFLGAMHQEYRLAAPFSHDLLARLDLAYVHLHRRASRLRLGTGEP
ncbi:hypothetical protein D9M71_764240 [compost metagenome]